MPPSLQRDELRLKTLVISGLLATLLLSTLGVIALTSNALPVPQSLEDLQKMSLSGLLGWLGQALAFSRRTDVVADEVTIDQTKESKPSKDEG